MNSNYDWKKVMLAEQEINAGEHEEIDAKRLENAKQFDQFLNKSIESVMEVQVNDLLNLPSISGFNVQEYSVKLTKSFTKELRDTTLGGKFTRAKSLLAFILLHTKDREGDAEIEYFEVAAALEFFQNSMLIHDDIIDKDERRRGRKSSWLQIGVEKAILLGDLYLILADTTFNDAILEMRRSEIISEEAFESCRFIWDSMKRDVIFGQVADIDFTNTPITKLKDKRSINKAAEINSFTDLMKTASYTTLAPFLLGQVIGANIDIDEIDESQVTEAVLDGSFFQMENDRNDLAKDLRKGRISGFILMLISEYGDDEEFLKTLLEVAGKKEDITDEDIKNLDDLIDELQVSRDQ